MKVSIGAKTDPGRRPNNEDQLAVIDVRRLNLRADSALVIADGMGGRNYGEQAAALAVESIQNTLLEMLHADRVPAVGIADALDSALRKANSRVYEMASRDQETRGMGTTCVAAVIEGDYLYLAHAGDSRAYLFRGGTLRRLTNDHSYVAEQVRAGVLTEENARQSRFRNVITRAVGIEPTIAPELTDMELKGGDALLICTDGLTNMVPESEIAQALVNATSPQSAADNLVNIANRNGGKDNITAIVARIELGDRTQRLHQHDLSGLRSASTETQHERTQEMRADDLAAAVEKPQNGYDHKSEDETPTVLGAGASRSESKTAPQTTTAGLRPGPEGAIVPRNPAPQAARRNPITASRLAAIALGVLSLALVAFSAETVHVLLTGGYYPISRAPFFERHTPALYGPVDLSHAAYNAPVLFSPTPVNPDLLIWSSPDRSLFAVGKNGELLRFDELGDVTTTGILPGKRSLYALPLPETAPLSNPPGVDANTPAAKVALPAKAHWAMDSAGDIYIADPAAHVIRKLDPAGKPLALIGAGRLVDPEALAVSPDGTVFVVDGVRVRVIWAHVPPRLLVKAAT